VLSEDLIESVVILQLAICPLVEYKNPELLT
jgi:hypothetical protein